MMFQSMTGILPLVGKDAFDTLWKHVHEEPPLMADVRPDLSISPAVQRIVSRALEKDLVLRYQTGEEMVSDLLNCLTVEETGGHLALQSLASGWTTAGVSDWSQEPQPPQPQAKAPPVSASFEAKTAPPADAATILKEAGLVNTQDLQQAKAVVDHVGGDIAAILVATGKLERNMLDAARKCKSAIEKKEMSLSQSCVLLNYCFRAKCAYEAALEELGMR
jgi:hypothetical protein